MSYFRFVSDCDEAAAPTEPAASATVAPDPFDDYSPPLPRPAYRTSWRGQFRPATVSALRASVDSGAALDVLKHDISEFGSAEHGAGAAEGFTVAIFVFGLIYAASISR